MELRAGYIAMLACLVLIAVVMTVSALTGQQVSQFSNLTDNEFREVVISLERTRCYGNCPAYKVSISGDGSVTYDGEDNVKVKSKKQTHIELVDFKRIVSEFAKANYFSINAYTEKDCSCTVCTDMPTAITSIQVKGASHRVEHYYGCRCAPKALWDLETAIDKIARTEQWTGDVSKQGPFGTTCFNK